MTYDVVLPEILQRGIDPASPEAVRLSFARAEIPLNPNDRLNTLAALLNDPAIRVRETAHTTLSELPGEFLDKALRDRSLGEVALDVIVNFHDDLPDVVKRTLSHPNVGPMTLGRFVASDDPVLISRIAENQRALERDPEVALRLLKNPLLEPGVAGRLRSLFVDAPKAAPEPEEASAPEASVGSGVEIPEEVLAELPEEVRHELEAGEAGNLTPDLFSDEDATRDGQNLYQLIQTLTVPEKIKLAMFGTKGARRLLARDHNKVVINAVIRSPKIREDEVIVMAQERTMPEEVIAYMFTRKEWLKNYKIRHALVYNPKTPIPKSLRLLDTLNERDLRALSKSRNVPNVVSSTALKHVMRKVHGRR